MAGKMLSTEPAVDPTASVRDCQLGAYTDVGARTVLLEVAMADYSYVVNDAQITYTTIGKFCSIAAMTRINPGNHPMHRASQAHFTYRASSYFSDESDDADFFAWRRGHHVHIGHDVWIGHCAIILPGPCSAMKSTKPRCGLPAARSSPWARIAATARPASMPAACWCCRALSICMATPSSGR